MFTNFYNGSIRRMVVAFGSLFNQIYIDKAESTGTKTVLVPIAYAPKEKYKVRLSGDPYFQNPNQITLPRMAFEITGYQYDSVRKRNSTLKHVIRPTASDPRGVDYTFAEVPYNIDFGLYIYVRNMEDGLRIIEQILPFFAPEFVVTVNFDDVNKKVDVPIYLNSVSSEEDYEGDFETRRSIVFTLNFTMKTYLFGAKKNYKEIRVVQAGLWNYDVFGDQFVGGVTYYPGNTLAVSNYADVIIGISGPSGASSNANDYSPYAKIYQPQSGGGSTYSSAMTSPSNGLTVDWNI
jgi:T4-like virus Myoviridae tail sheath stabiliser